VKLARELARAGTVDTFDKGGVLMKQGDSDNHIVFLLHGEVSVCVNERQVAIRAAGTHIGEMALVDPVAKRSATVVATETTVVLHVAEHRFSRIAARFPDLWRRIAVEVAKRLRERNRMLRAPHSEPVLFIGSSTEGLSIAEACHEYFNRRNVIPKLWKDGVFEASSTTIESLVALSRDADFAVLVLSADDTTRSRGRQKASPRDNVIFELGLLMGSLGRERVFILKPRTIDIRIPSDLLGVTWLEYRRAGPGTLNARVRAACTSVFSKIKTLGPR
jgi:predicted nucleotide-binding protein